MNNWKWNALAGVLIMMVCGCGAATDEPAAEAAPAAVLDIVPMGEMKAGSAEARGFDVQLPGAAFDMAGAQYTTVEEPAQEQPRTFAEAQAAADAP